MAHYGHQDQEYANYGQAVSYGYPSPQQPPPPLRQEMSETGGYQYTHADPYYYNNTNRGGDIGERKLMEPNSLDIASHRDHNNATPYLHGSNEYDDADDREPRRRSCLDCICCGCCTCCPRWMRYISCCLLIIIVALGITVGVLAAIFKTPEVKFNGLQGEPQFSLQQLTTAHFEFNLNITVNNPNVESVTFETIVAKAYYPGYPNLQLGGGQVNNTKIVSYGVTPILFPFSLDIDAVQDSTKAILSDVLRKCGLGGGQKQEITINYEVTPTIRIIGIPISPTISNQASFPCPNQVEQVLSGIGNLGGLVPLAENLLNII